MVDMTTTSAAAQLSDDRLFVMAVARRIVRDVDAARDVAQDAMLQAFRYRASFRGESNYRTWLYRIATTTALSHLRRERALARRAVACEQEAAAPLAAAPRSPVDAITHAETAREVSAQIAGLPPLYREILALRYYDDCTEREAASALGVSVTAVKVRTHRAKRALRARLSPEVAGREDKRDVAHKPQRTRR
jgi:RNA polymerase sigma-70 factor (ECF subfamily)